MKNVVIWILVIYGDRFSKIYIIISIYLPQTLKKNKFYSKKSIHIQGDRISISPKQRHSSLKIGNLNQ